MIGLVTTTLHLDIMEDVVVILDGSKVSRLITTLAFILIAIVSDTTVRSGTSTSENPTLRNNPAIPFVVEPSATGNDAADLFANILGNLFGDLT